MKIIMIVAFLILMCSTLFWMLMAMSAPKKWQYRMATAFWMLSGLALFADIILIAIQR